MEKQAKNKKYKNKKYLVIRKDKLLILTDRYIDAIRAYKRRFPKSWRVATRVRHLSRYGTARPYLRLSPRAKVTPGIYTLKNIDASGASDRVRKKLYELLLNMKVERKPLEKKPPRPPAALVFRPEHCRTAATFISVDVIYDHWLYPRYKSYYIKAKLLVEDEYVTIYETSNRYIAIVDTDTDRYYVSVPKRDFAEIRQHGVNGVATIKEIVDRLGNVVEKYVEEYEITPLAKLLEQLREQVAFDAWESI